MTQPATPAATPEPGALVATADALQEVRTIRALPPLGKPDQEAARKLWVPQFTRAKQLDLYDAVTVGDPELAKFGLSVQAVLQKVSNMDYDQAKALAQKILGLLDEKEVAQLDPTPHKKLLGGLETIEDIVRRVHKFFERFESKAKMVQDETAKVVKVEAAHTDTKETLKAHAAETLLKLVLVKQLEWAATTWLAEIGYPEQDKREAAAKAEAKAAAADKREVDPEIMNARDAWNAYVTNVEQFRDSKVQLKLHVYQVSRASAMQLQNEGVILQALHNLRTDTINSWYDLIYIAWTAINEVLSAGLASMINSKTSALRVEAADYLEAATKTGCGNAQRKRFRPRGLQAHDRVHSQQCHFVTAGI